MTTQHALIAPSSLGRTRQCPASVVMQQGRPEPEDDEDAREGEAAHWAFAEELAGRITAEGQIAPNGVMLTGEMLEAVDMGVKYVKDRTAGAPLMLETPVRIPGVHREHCWGTFDVACWITPDHLFVGDFKFGHRYVPAERNSQLIAYAVGILDALPDLPNGRRQQDTDTRVTLAIIQPRCYVGGSPIREWSGWMSDLRGEVNMLAGAAEEALGPNPRTHTGEECRDCRARINCETFQRSAFAAMQYSGQATAFNMTPSAAGVELHMVRDAIAKLKAAESGLEEQLRAKPQGSGWRLDSSPGRETWSMDAALVTTVADSLGVNVRKPDALITPNQARKAGLDEATVAAMSKRSSSLKLVPDDAERMGRIFATAAGGA